LTIKSTLDTATSSALPHPAHRWTRHDATCFFARQYSIVKDLDYVSAICRGRIPPPPTHS